ncbi:hypothetical protein NOF04DRAFT_9881 [Fusarium oxysporum II5]|uniref:Uncharacterized protein n=2 Tax=Fusarium oxysporum species complex TaxID=171631 RepID=X0JHV5_FUSO5|nr:uncharacterized protein FOIG_11527 [Fusarium odoratissimum NRRL 54006]EXL95986.1 hypothetical protein FOIG_11527 [Fusarium odoratissimum NRRL 54006]KAK2123775.1 hypothetical protein NOF04DRAFT_9881 [Fusarium oxysporum II5]TXB95594.1 hypothetical protein FocTR4_00016223 [Fusarium oxysporum f. sp. cubense]
MPSTSESTGAPAVSALIATATAYIDVFRTLNTDALFRILSDEYSHREVMSSFTVTIKQTWPNPSLRQVLVWADSETNFHRHLRDSDDDEEWTKWGE